MFYTISVSSLSFSFVVFLGAKCPQKTRWMSAARAVCRLLRSLFKKPGGDTRWRPQAVLILGGYGEHQVAHNANYMHKIYIHLHFS